MQHNLPQRLNVLLVVPDAHNLVDEVQAISPERLNVINAWPDFYDELAEEWSPRTMDRLGGPKPEVPASDPDQKAAMLQNAHALYGRMPFPKHLGGRVPSLLWAHFGFAGVSNLIGSDFWAPPFTVTSGRGYSGARPIAESVMAATLMHARRMDLAVLNSNATFDPTLVPPMVSVEGKTIGIVGLGGIGANVATMARGIGMRVIATRRSANDIQENVDGVDVLYPVSKTSEMLAESDVVVVCAMWTAETEGMFDDALFSAVKPGAYFINVARGELVQELPLLNALRSGRLSGAYLDVWPDDMIRLPHPELLEFPAVTITPHVSQQADTDQNFGFRVFCENLQRLLAGEALVNIVDWERGY